MPPGFLGLKNQADDAIRQHLADAFATDDLRWRTTIGTRPRVPRIHLQKLDYSAGRIDSRSTPASAGRCADISLRNSHLIGNIPAGGPC
jgi:hypothetical protein